MAQISASISRNPSPHITATALRSNLASKMAQVMTPNPECASLETTILDALHMMHDGKFLHLPVLDKDGYIVACVNVLQITHAAISLVESSFGAVNGMANTIMQEFWDSAFALKPLEDYDTHSAMLVLSNTGDEMILLSRMEALVAEEEQL